jgi:NDP-sugar pyrophosphorylase family protein
MSLLPVAVLAGGAAARLGALTADKPKSLLAIAGRPFIDWQLELLARQGIGEAVLCVGHFGEQIAAAVGDGARFGLRVRYSFDGATALGTGGALRQALPLLGSHFFVLYGDSYLPCSFSMVQAAYEASGAPALMTVLRNADRWGRSNVLFRDRRLVEYDKHSPRRGMAHIDFGLSVWSAQALQGHPPGAAFDLADLCHTLSLHGELAGHEVSGRFYEIGSLEGIRDTEHYLRSLRAADELRPTVLAGSR